MEELAVVQFTRLPPASKTRNFVPDENWPSDVSSLDTGR
jgi:hypothetical protein